MAATNYKLTKHFKTNKYSTLEDILPCFINANRLKIKSTFQFSSGYVFEYSAIALIQKHLKKNSIASSIYNNYTIQSIIIRRSPLYDNRLMIKVMYDRWLGLTIDCVCDYLKEFYNIDEDTLDIAYSDGEAFRE